MSVMGHDTAQGTCSSHYFHLMSVTQMLPLESVPACFPPALCVLSAPSTEGWDCQTRGCMAFTLFNPWGMLEGQDWEMGPRAVSEVTGHWSVSGLRGTSACIADCE